MSKVHVFTSAAFNYIPKVRMLFESIKRIHPDWVLHIALPDTVRPEADLSGELFDTMITIEDLDIPDWKGWAFCHRIVELATAIKPFALKKILAREDCAKAFYFDPDMVLFSPLDDLLEALESNDIILTPHVTEPETDIMAVMNNEISAMKHGIYNLGFVGVRSSEEGKRFADWWGQRLYNFCRDEIPQGIFTDQRWIDHVPVFFDDVKIIKSPRHNVAPWNLTSRKIGGSFAAGFSVNDIPLGFYHFTGFDSGDHKTMMELNSQGNPSARELVQWYLNETANLSKDPLSATPWAFATFENGEPISKAQRLVYRERVDLQKAFPDPFVVPGYYDWWQANAAVEFPALLDEQTEEAELQRLTAHLTPGFRGGEQHYNMSKIMYYWSIAKDSQSRQALIQKGMEVLKREGPAGLVKRLTN